MRTSFQVFRLLALAAWVGGIAFFAFAVAPVAFKTMPDAHQAGTIVRGTLLILHRIGLGAGSVYLFFTLALLATHDTHPSRAVELVVVVCMLALTLYLQQSVMPHMETDRLTLGGDVDVAPREAPARQHFEQLHRTSESLEGAILLQGIALLCLAPLGKRPAAERFV